MIASAPERRPRANRPVQRAVLAAKVKRLAALVATILACTTPMLAQEDADADARAAQRLLLEAEKRLEQGDFEGALAELSAVATRLPDSQEAPIALLRTAQLQADAGRDQQALAAINEIERRYSTSPAAAGAAALAGEISMRSATDLGTLEDTRSELRRVPNLFGSDAYPDLEARSEARVRSAEISILLDDLEVAAADFLSVLEDEPTSRWTARARLGFADVLLYQGQWRAAVYELQRLKDDIGTGSPDAESQQLAAEARQRLTLLHRMVLRPDTKSSSWLRARDLDRMTGALQKPTAMAASEQGALAVADQGAKTTFFQPTESAELQRRSTPDPRPPFFDHLGREWAATKEGVLAPGGGATRIFQRPDGKRKPLNGLLAVAPGRLQDWYVADKELGGLVVFDNSGRSIARIDTGPGEIVDVTSDARGRVWALDRKAQRILQIGPDRSLRHTIPLRAEKPVALAVDRLGNVYVMDHKGIVEVLDPNGGVRQRIAPPLPGGISLKKPVDLAVDGSGRLFLLDEKPPRVVVLE